MPQLKERPSSLLDASPTARRNSRYALLEDVDRQDRRRSIGIGIVLTIGVWAACFFLFNLLITQLAEQHARATAGAATKRKPTFDIELQPDEFLMPQKPKLPPDRFVETNPDAPENVPDNTRNFGAQNQQVAQPVPTPAGKSDTPATEGKKDWESNQIVSGQLHPPQPVTPPEPPPTPDIKQSPQITQATPQQREQVPLSGDTKIQGDSPTGYGLDNIKVPEHKTPVTADAKEYVIGSPDTQQDTKLSQFSIPKIDPKHPQPRKQIARQNVRPAVLKENQFGTQNIGALAFDAKWSNYGQYLQKLIDTVQIQFDDLNNRSKVWPPTGTKVTVKFVLDSEGKIAEVVSTDSNGGDQATRICVSAITDRSPYGKWTDDMIAMLGDSQEMTFTFYYGTP